MNRSTAPGCNGCENSCWNKKQDGPRFAPFREERRGPEPRRSACCWSAEAPRDPGLPAGVPMDQIRSYSYSTNTRCLHGPHGEAWSNVWRHADSPMGPESASTQQREAFNDLRQDCTTTTSSADACRPLVLCHDQTTPRPVKKVRRRRHLSVFTNVHRIEQNSQREGLSLISRENGP